jgi:hypothetical protein
MPQVAKNVDPGTDLGSIPGVGRARRRRAGSSGRRRFRPAQTAARGPHVARTQRTRFGGESRCNGCGATMKWAIITDRSRVVSISLSDPLEPLRLVVRDHHHAPASRGVTDTHPSSS